MDSNSIKEAVNNKQQIIYTGKGRNTTYNTEHLGLHKLESGEWVEVATYSNEDGEMFSRQLHMFEDFHVST
ncbi:hypothetical protein L1267_10850 [Pseudoalteromonas sp. OFAV1]|jgi:hypothetical protein|uniref:hypothetical protein n=1 Tax=Pseudoalteromonas sp. OFAV1 TaxID=2908892 RepID=UPI001F3421DB|nr:hypothetical protein [Pseudoalteromonas sp. OFAV1]MCF2900901.1 hypothetical protein [Pseudoalteromonas sp. OFAV1]